MSDASFGDYPGARIRELAKKHPESFPADVMARIDAEYLKFWEMMGVKMAIGEIKGNATVWKFNMGNRFGWKDEIEQAHQKIMVQVGYGEGRTVKRVENQTDVQDHQLITADAPRGAEEDRLDQQEV
ncbi:MAG: hypothetical protein KDC45_04250 [Bacteroidetes bacterium]|nr:hypothetical protein [Bacteroidota bacterium]